MTHTHTHTISHTQSFSFISIPSYKFSRFYASYPVHLHTVLPFTLVAVIFSCQGIKKFHNLFKYHNIFFFSIWNSSPWGKTQTNTARHYSCRTAKLLSSCQLFWILCLSWWGAWQRKGSIQITVFGTENNTSPLDEWLPEMYHTAAKNTDGIQTTQLLLYSHYSL